MRLPNEPGQRITQWIYVFFRTPIFVDFDADIFDPHIRVHAPEKVEAGGPSTAFSKRFACLQAHS